MCFNAEHYRIKKEREQERLKRKAVSDKAFKLMLKIVECQCAGLEKTDYDFINQELRKIPTTELVLMSETQKSKFWKKLAPKLYAILKEGHKKFNFVIPEHLEVILAKDK